MTMGQVTALLNSIGWTLPVLPELDDLTVGEDSLFMHKRRQAVTGSEPRGLGPLPPSPAVATLTWVTPVPGYSLPAALFLSSCSWHCCFWLKAVPLGRTPSAPLLPQETHRGSLGSDSWRNHGPTPFLLPGKHLLFSCLFLWAPSRSHNC